MTTILLARHGETDWNREGRFQGHADPPLNDTGRAQAQELGATLASDGISVIYSSDLRRAAETAKVVAARLALPVSHDAALREIDVGSWSGLTRDEVRTRFPDGFARWLAGEIGHDGETREQLVRRIVPAVLEIGRRHPGERVLVVSHGGAIRALQRTLLGEPRPVLPNCGVMTVALVDGALRPID